MYVAMCVLTAAYGNSISIFARRKRGMNTHLFACLHPLTGGGGGGPVAAALSIQPTTQQQQQSHRRRKMAAASVSSDIPH